jgi:hypothetical protein
MKPTRWIAILLVATTVASAQSVYWKKDYIRDNDGTIAEVTPPPSDQVAPSAPSNLVASNVTATQAQFSWNPSSDSGGSGLAGYKIYRGSVPVGSTTGTSWIDNTLKPQTNYTYKAIAVDVAQNYSAASNSVNFTTPAP